MSLVQVRPSTPYWGDPLYHPPYVAVGQNLGTLVDPGSVLNRFLDVRIWSTELRGLVGRCHDDELLLPKAWTHLHQLHQRHNALYPNEHVLALTVGWPGEAANVYGRYFPTLPCCTSTQTIELLSSSLAAAWPSHLEDHPPLLQRHRRSTRATSLHRCSP